MTDDIKHFIAKMLFGKPMIMRVHMDKNGNLYGGAIHENDNKSPVTSNDLLPESEYIGDVRIYL